MPQPTVPEIVLSRVWHDGWHARELRLVDGRRLSVVYPGTWTHSDGPDFRNAMIELDGRLVRGPVEIHLRASNWHQHGHQHDPSYDEVALHVVLSNDLEEPVHGPGGVPVATLELQHYLPGSLEDYLAEHPILELGRLGRHTCLPTLAGERPSEIRAALRAKGWERLVQKQMRFRQDFERLPPAEVLYRGLLDGLGLVRNRDGMALVAERLPVTVVERICTRLGKPAVLSALLGVAGFLPLSPAHQDLAGLSPVEAPDVDGMYDRVQADYALEPLSPSIWNLNRVRPSNHPIRRLVSFASLVSSSDDSGLLARFLSSPLDNGTAWRALLSGVDPPIGDGRQEQIIINVFAPFIAAYAEAIEDDQLAEEVSTVWERLPGNVRDSVARKTKQQIVGKRRFPIRLAIEEQGLHQIGRFGCADLRCFECPIAALALKYEDGSL